MDERTRHALEAQRDRLLAENQRLQREWDAAAEVAVNHPNFSPTSNTVADERAARVSHRQDEVIDQLHEIDRLLDA